MTMRAVLVFNPKATATSARVRDVIARALESQLKLDVVETRRRGHATDIAAQAARDDIDLVVALGGDGTVNEVVNGIVGTPTELAVVPGGSTNVFARALGLSGNPVDATSEILDALRLGRRRTVNLGVANGRYFTFCAGVGIDAEVVRVVERHRRNGRSPTPALYVRSAVAHFFTGTERRAPSIVLSRPGVPDEEGLFNVIVANGTPWTYFGEHPVDPCPHADFDAGLDVLAMRKLGVVSTLRVVRQMFDSKPRIRSKATFQVHDAAEFTITSDRPLAYQLDGDYLGEIETVTFKSLPDAISVVV
jgi:diacylglycerol kinase family enzyme